mmetsp:Transcript_104929/g.146301  ORF Transcript_104929/g.146301 Transcript_104929/m.146301 type:complete len:169 (-) Transcript_104929:57-563(-)
MTMDPQLLTGLGAAVSIFLSATGSALASSHAAFFAIRGKDLKHFLPIVVAGVLAIYGIIVSILLVGKFQSEITEAEGYRNLSAGLAVGLACCASGLGIAHFMKQINDEHSARTTPSSASTELTTPLVGRRMEAVFSHHEPAFLHLFLCMCFLEAIGLYGLIVALFLMG